MAKTRRRPSPKAPNKPRRSAERGKSTKSRGESPARPPSFALVGIGASAGGLEACTQLLRSLPKGLNMAIILVQHLAAEHESVLPELLSAATLLPVHQARDGVRVEAGNVYVMPPSVQMRISRGVLRLSPRPHDRSQHMPIDYFLRSLAEYAQSRAIGVILSGTASDGSLGLREIKGAGGIAIAQDPKTAKYDGMPRSAIATGIVDLVLSPADIAAELERLANYPLVQPETAIRPPAPEKAASPEEHLDRIFLMLRSATGVDFAHYKLPTIHRRLHRRMALHKIDTVERYIKYLQTNPDEVQALYQDILIHVTQFFREPESFDVLRQKAFPEIVAGHRGEKPIRVWVPGCSTGEEAYSVAISLLEFLDTPKGGAPIQIFATDISELAIEHARAGIYPESITADVSAERLRRFFQKVDGSYRISKTVRDLCVFARQDLTRDPPFSRLDLVLCRNVLIYLGAELQKRLIDVFHYALTQNGFLLLGSAETVGTRSDLFGIVDKRHKLYLKKLGASNRADMEFPPAHAGHADTAKKPPAEARNGAGIQNEANRMILARYSPAGVLVDNELKILQFRGQTGTFLQPAPGDASLDLLKMAREGLLYGLRGALLEARKSDAPVRKENIQVRQDGGTRPINLEIIPISNNGGKYFLVLFEQASHELPPAPPVAPIADLNPKKRGKKDKAAKLHGAAEERVTDLEKELAASREYLQAMIQDLEAANEELQSANEEILSSNEELQSTNEELDTAKEELQSTNEELNTVNEELQGRNEELSRVNSDLINLLGSVQIAIVMVDGDLRIRRFTPMAEKMLNLIPSDIGRPISDIKPNIDLPDLEQIITNTIDSVTIQERQCTDRHGKRYLLRVRPYKNLENRIDGAVLVLFDPEQAPLPPAGVEPESKKGHDTKPN